MQKATITEIKNHLSAFLDRVRHGEPVLITDRGRPVARLETVLADMEGDAEGRLMRLERKGMVRRARSAPPLEEIAGTPPPAPRQGASLLQAVLKEREENR